MIWNHLKVDTDWVNGLGGLDMSFESEAKIDDSPYRVDYLCREKKIILEEDDSGHRYWGRFRYDIERDWHFHNLGYLIIRIERFSAPVDVVIERINFYCRQSVDTYAVCRIARKQGEFIWSEKDLWYALNFVREFKRRPSRIACYVGYLPGMFTGRWRRKIDAFNLRRRGTGDEKIETGLNQSDPHVSAL